MRGRIRLSIGGRRFYLLGVKEEMKVFGIRFFFSSGVRVVRFSCDFI